MNNRDYLILKAIADFELNEGNLSTDLEAKLIEEGIDVSELKKQWAEAYD